MQRHPVSESILVGLLRALIFGLLLSIAVGLGFRLISNHFLLPELFGLIVVLVLALAIGPLWPSRSAVNELVRFTESNRRTVLVLEGLSLMSAGACCAYFGLTNAQEVRPATKLLRAIQHAFGDHAVGLLWTTAGVALIAAAVVILASLLSSKM